MKILVFSDSHGVVSGMVEAVRQEQPDMIVHLGDYVRDAMRLSMSCPEQRLDMVQGNCDGHGRAPVERMLEAEGCKLILCHGHTYGVKQGLSALLRHGQECGASAVLFGHTHIPMQTERGGVLLFNPGSAAESVDTNYGVLNIENGVVTGRLCRLTWEDSLC